MKPSQLGLKAAWAFALTGLLSACSSSGQSAGGSACHYITVGNSGGIACSPDGVTWSQRASGTDQDLSGVGANPSGAVVVVGDVGTVLYSTDHGATFHAATSPTTKALEAVAADGAGRIVIAGNDTRAYYSDDGGKTWTPGQVIDAAADQGMLINALASDGGERFLAAGTAYGSTVVQNHVYLSTDGGVSWSSVYTGPALSVGGSLSEALEGLAADGAGHYVAVGMSSQAYYAAGNPPSSASWTASSGFPSGLLLGGAAWDAAHQKFIVAGFGATSTQQITGGVYVSGDNGQSFAQVCTAQSGAVAAEVAVGGGRFVVVAPGSAMSSSDGGQHCKDVHIAAGSTEVGIAVAYVP